MKGRIALPSLVALLVSSVVLAAEHQRARYTVISISNSNSVHATDINDQRLVVGYMFQPLPPPDEGSNLLGFIQNKRLVLPITGPDSNQTFAFGINDRGEITLFSTTPEGQSNSYLLSRGVYNLIEVPDSTYTAVYGLNNKGEIAGYYTVPPPAVQRTRAFVYRKGEYVTLDPLNGQRGAARSFDINDRGDVVGYFEPNDGNLISRGFLFHNGTYAHIEVPGATTTIAFSINNAGVIVGIYNGPSLRPGGFIYWKERFATVEIPGALSTEVRGINDRGDIVGHYVTADGELRSFRSHVREFWK